MRIAVLSGKGGTGKTLVSVNLASTIGNVTYVDADVEEPNGNLFFKPTDITKADVSIDLPRWDATKCTRCRECVDFCAFHALALVGEKMLVFDEVCHSCGGCELLCDAGAFSVRQKVIGNISAGYHGDTRVLSGSMNVGEASGVPIIRELMRECGDDAIIDCPPGSACTVMESIQNADYCVLVAEPTIFGVANLDMVVRLTALFGKRVGIVLNKCVPGESIARDYALQHGLDIVGEIAWDSRLAELTSRGEIAVEVDTEYRTIFGDILDRISSEVHL